MVEFGKYLQSNAVVEWNAHYVRYEYLKQLLKRLAAVRAPLEAAQRAGRDRSRSDVAREEEEEAEEAAKQEADNNHVVVDLPSDHPAEHGASTSAGPAGVFSVAGEFDRTLHMGPAGHTVEAAPTSLLRCLTPATLAALSPSERDIETSFVNALDEDLQRADAWFQKQKTYFRQQFDILQRQIRLLHAADRTAEREIRHGGLRRRHHQQQQQHQQQYQHHLDAETRAREYESSTPPMHESDEYGSATHSGSEDGDGVHAQEARATRDLTRRMSMLPDILQAPHEPDAEAEHENESQDGEDHPHDGGADFRPARFDSSAPNGGATALRQMQQQHSRMSAIRDEIGEEAEDHSESFDHSREEEHWPSPTPSPGMDEEMHPPPRDASPTLKAVPLATRDDLHLRPTRETSSSSTALLAAPVSRPVARSGSRTASATPSASPLASHAPSPSTSPSPTLSSSGAVVPSSSQSRSRSGRRSAPLVLGRRVLTSLKRSATAVREEVDSLQVHAHLRLRLLSSRAPWKTVATALKEVYRGLALLKEFKSLNYTAILKIVKKHDKHSGAPLYAPLMPTVNATHIFASADLFNFTLQVEDAFTQAYSASHAGADGRTKRDAATERKHALNHLRPTAPHMSYLVTFRLGLLCGLSMCLLMVLFFLIHFVALRTSVVTQLTPVVPIFRGLFLVILHLWCWGINVWLFHKHRINYQFIFEIDPKSELQFPQIMQVAALLTFGWFLSLDLYLATALLTDYWPDLVPGYFHFTLYMCILLMTICPFNYFARPTRLFLAKTLWHIVTTGWGPVAFRDFYTCNQLCSLVNVMNDLSYGICFYVSGDFVADDPTYCKHFQTNAIWVLPFLPYWFRFAQCLKRWKDSGARKQLYNAGKYALSLNTTLWSNLNKHFPDGGFVTPWILCAVASTITSYLWDVKADWGLMEWNPRAPSLTAKVLRQRRVVRWDGFYYFAMVTDGLMRLAWVLTISAPTTLGINIPTDYFKSIIYCVEVIRRNQWNFYRLENEHLANVENQRVVNIVPLKPAAKKNAATDANEVHNEKRGGIAVLVRGKNMVSERG